MLSDPLLNLRNSPLWFTDPFIYVLMLYHACSCCEEPFGVRLYPGKSEFEDLPQIKPKKELEGSLTTSETTIKSQDSYT